MQGICITKLINILLDVIPMQWSAHNVFPGKNLYYWATPQERTTKILRKHMIQSIYEYANAKTRFLRFTPAKADYITAHFKIHSITCLVKGQNNMIYIYTPFQPNNYLKPAQQQTNISPYQDKTTYLFVDSIKQAIVFVKRTCR